MEPEHYRTGEAAVSQKKSLLWIGDACCESGFARATHATLDVLREQYAVSVLGINYRGDPHPYPYPIYSALHGGDWAGVRRLLYVCDVVKPDVIVVQNDPWNVPRYMHKLQSAEEYRDVTIVGSIAVDGLNCQGYFLNDLSHVVFWTKFAEDEARRGGFAGKSSVIPLGVDHQTFYPDDRVAARMNVMPKQAFDVLGERAFIVGAIGRNQPRKRLDLTIQYFAKWVKTFNVRDAWLYLHIGPTGDEGYDVQTLANYYGVLDRLLVSEPPPWQGVEDQKMVDVYRSLNVYFSTTLGEGMGLPALEAMACGIPCILPSWSGFADWARGAAYLVPCSGKAVTCREASTIGGVMDEQAAVTALQRLYDDGRERERWAIAGWRRATEERFKWGVIGRRFMNVVDSVVCQEASV